jgi:glucose-1-phosphate adenylyltransferase
MHANTSADSSILTFVLAGGRGKRLFPLTSRRAKPLVPFGGVFQIIDFTLSNCVNSGLEHAYLLTQYKADSVRQYIETSSWTTNFVCLPPSPPSVYHGTADSLYQNLHLFRHQKADYVLVLASDHIYKMDYRKLIRFHASHGGDATIAAVQCPPRLTKELGVLEVAERGQVVRFEEKPEQSRERSSDSSRVLASMGVYVFNTSALHEAIIRDAGKFSGSHEFGKDVLPSLIHTHRVFAYDFTNGNGALGNYWRDVGTIDSYHRTHMELLLLTSSFDPYNDARWPIYAGGKDLSFRHVTTDSSWVVDSIISPGAEVAGATILQSIISPSAYVAPTAQVQGSVLMPGVRVGRHARIRRAIIDEGAVIPDGERIGYDAAEDRLRFFVTESGVVAVHSSNAGASRTVPSPINRHAQVLHK